MTDIEFQSLIQLKKIFAKKGVILPFTGNCNTYDLKSTTTSDKFYLDIDRRGSIELKVKLQSRYVRNRLPLVRIDINSPPHINPDGRKLSRNHIHIFRECDNDTGNLPWAYELNDVFKTNFDLKSLNFMSAFNLICKYCNIEAGDIQGAI